MHDQMLNMSESEDQRLGLGRLSPYQRRLSSGLCQEGLVLASRWWWSILLGPFEAPLKATHRCYSFELGKELKEQCLRGLKAVQRQLGELRVLDAQAEFFKK